MCIKIERLQTEADLAYGRLVDACKGQETAEKALDDAQRESAGSTLEIQELQQQLGELRTQVIERSRGLVIASLELESQSTRIRALEARQKTTDRRRDAMRKKIERAKASKGENERKNGLLPAERVHEYHLKGPAGVIRPEARDMIRKLACHGVSTERMSEVISIVAEGLGMRVIGSVSARSVARFMLEGLVQARIQVAQELSETNCRWLCSINISMH